MQTIPATIKERAEKFHPSIVDIRRHMHQYPELSFKEYETARFIADKLKAMNIQFEEGIGGNGLVGRIKGGQSNGKTVALRADFDALPIQELNEVPYKSKNDGIMHACGHDVHTSSLLGAAKILQDIRNELKADIRLIFQPGEEKIPGGASLMIADGVLKNPVPSSIYGQHVMPELETGTVGFRPGKYMASSDEVFIRVIGKGGHAAMPDLNTDPVVISAHMITTLQQLISRKSPPASHSVFSIGKVNAQGANNVIPDEVNMAGTFRTFDEEWRERAHEEIEQICTHLAESMGGRCDLTINRGYPCLINDPKLTGEAVDTAREFLGNEQVVDLEMRATAEDFAYYTHEIPGCFYRLGTGNVAKGITSSIHTPTFDIDETALKTGAGLMAFLAYRKSEKI